MGEAAYIPLVVLSLGRLALTVLNYLVLRPPAYLRDFKIQELYSDSKQKLHI